MTDHEQGLKVLRAFYDYSKYEYPFACTYSFQELLDTLHKRVGGKFIEDGIGLGVNSVDGFNDSKINSSMQALAKASGGKIPSKNGDFFAFMTNEATKVNFVDAIAYTATESAKDIVTGAQKIGDSVLLSGQLLTWLLPVAVIYFGYMYLNKKVLG
jgi:hypothetical protein